MRGRKFEAKQKASTEMTMFFLSPQFIPLITALGLAITALLLLFQRIVKGVSDIAIYALDEIGRIANDYHKMRGAVRKENRW